MKNVILIGFMSCGKTIAGKKSAEILCKNFIDIDQCVEINNKMPIYSIFSNFGENYFRNLEHKILEKSLLEKNAFISTGGGIIELQKNIDLLKKSNVYIIWLNTEFDIILKRIKKNSKNRPLANINDPFFELKLKEKFKKRLEIYKSISDVQITTKKLTFNEIVFVICKIYHIMEVLKKC